MDTTEKHVMAWLPNMWKSANRFDEYSDWSSVCDALYGALMACNQVDAVDDYEAYSFLAGVARIRRLGCIASKYKEAA